MKVHRPSLFDGEEHSFFRFDKTRRLRYLQKNKKLVKKDHLEEQNYKRIQEMAIHCNHHVDPVTDRKEETQRAKPNEIKIDPNHKGF
jgi:hypothetical protein